LSGRALASAVVLTLALVLAAPAATGWLGLGPDLSTIPADGRLVEIAPGRVLHVVELGSGEPIVLVHGLPSNVGDWAETPARLAALGYRAIAYDRVGYGTSSRDPSNAADAFSYASNARDLRALLDALGVESALVAGWSYGGGVAQVLAESYPERVRALALVASVGPLASPGEEAVERIARSPVGVALFSWAASVGPVARAVTRGALEDAFSGAAPPPGWHERTVAQLSLPGTMAAFVREEQRHDPSVFHPERLELPALVLHGTDDRSVLFAVGEDLAGRLPRAELVAVPAGSHMLPATHTQLVVERIAALAAAR
jgi:non-heme chloroperoxidase